MSESDAELEGEERTQRRAGTAAAAAVAERIVAGPAPSSFLGLALDDIDPIVILETVSTYLWASAVPMAVAARQTDRLPLGTYSTHCS